jgi:hypothetical protein
MYTNISFIVNEAFLFIWDCVSFAVKGSTGYARFNPYLELGLLFLSSVTDPKPSLSISTLSCSFSVTIRISRFLENIPLMFQSVFFSACFNNNFSHLCISSKKTSYFKEK